MTIVSTPALFDAPLNEYLSALASGQITCTQEPNNTPDLDFSSHGSGQITYPLGWGVEDREYKGPKSIPAVRRLALDPYDYTQRNNPNHRSNDDKINSWLNRSALDYLNRRFHRENKKLTSCQDVEAHLFTLACARLKPISDYEAATGGGKGHISYEHVERYAQRSAQYACEVWRPDYFEVRSRWGAKGGAKSKRGPKYSMTDYRATEQMSRKDAAAYLGVHPKTIDRMRAKHAPPPYIPIPGILPEPEQITSDHIPVDVLLNGL